jgi:phytoene synthase
VLGLRDLPVLLGRALLMPRGTTGAAAVTPEQYVQQTRRGQRLELLLRLPVPAAAQPRRHHRLLRLLPRGGRRGRRDRGPGSSRPAKLAWWAARSAAPSRGAAHPPGHAGADAAWPASSTIGEQPPAAVIEGCEMDLRQIALPRLPGPARYCHLVAGVVGEVASGIFGRTQPGHRRLRRTGWAWRCKLTNIIRDVGDDARRGRIYLPMSELQRFEVKAEELLRRSRPWATATASTPLMRFQAARAHAAFDEAFALLPAADRKAQKPGLMMAHIYRTLLREIEARQASRCCTSASR